MVDRYRARTRAIYSIRVESKRTRCSSNNVMNVYRHRDSSYSSVTMALTVTFLISQ